jgi:Ser/Thr protein kinase RdoA (MazF antagonist)
MPKPTASSADHDVASAEIVAARLSDSYGLPDADLAFLGGELDRNYRVSTGDGRVFLAKLRTKADRNGALQWQKDILLHLADRTSDGHLGVAVPSLVRTLDGHLDVGIDVGSERWLLTVLNWVSGTDMVRVAEHSQELLVDIGATAARVTKALEGFESASIHITHHWDITRAADVIEECLALDPTLDGSSEAQIALRWFKRVRPLLSTLPAALVHNDFNDNNVLVGDRDGVQRVTGILDFNDALYTVRVAEPAIAGAYAMLRKDDPLTAMGLVIAGYHGVTPLTDDELAVAYPLAAARLAVQALTWGLRGRTVPTAYGAMRMQHTLPTLRRIVQIDPHTASEHLHASCGRRGNPRPETRS